jgi:uncharacterized protein with PhoU and TrkA domain
MTTFMDFLGGFIMGAAYADKSEEDMADPKQIIRSDTVVSASQNKVSKLIQKSSSQVNQDVTIDQKITVDCGSKPFLKRHYELKDVQRTWWGKKIKGTGCPAYGCCYDISQSGQVKLAAVNSNVLKDTKKMYNTVIQEVKNEMEMRVDAGKSGDDPSMTAIDSAIAESELTNVKKVEKILEKLIDTNVQNAQNVHLEYKGPLKCVNKCGDPPSAGTIDQAVNVDVAAENITKTILYQIEENIVKMSAQKKSKISDVSLPMMYTYAFMTVTLIITVYSLFFFLTTILIAAIGALKGVHKAVLQGTMGIIDITHIFTVLLMIILYLLLGIIMCLYKHGLGFRGMFCFI